MNKSTRIPPLGALRMIKANDILPDKYNTFGFDKGFFWQKTRQFFQGDSNYVQKVSYGDDILLYIDSLAPKIDITLFDDNGNVVTVLISAMIPAIVLPGNVDSYYGDIYNTLMYNFNPETLELADGYYYIVIEELYGDTGDTENTFVVSECLLVKNGTFKKTMLLEYSHDINNYDILFEGITAGYLFNFRTEMILLPDDFASDDTGFSDMNSDLVNLNSIPYRVFKLIVGAPYGAPDWVMDKVNRILSCSYIFIDGVRYIKNNGANWNLTKNEVTNLMSGTIQLREHDNQSGWEWNNSDDMGTARIFTSPYSLVFS